jgi:pimeloyl-ACP methyl ester carboxylesterase
MDTPEAIVDSLDDQAELSLMPCAAGSMPFRRWNRGAGSVVVLLHGGAGSWTHWIANIAVLASQHEVIAPDLPGLGDAAALPGGYSVTDAAGPVIDGLRALLDGRRDLHIIAFSWGCTVAVQVAAALQNRLSSLLLTGPGALGNVPLGTHMQPLKRRMPDMTEADLEEMNRENLARLMLHDRGAIDDLALHLQLINTRRSRFNSPKFARDRVVLDHLAKLKVPLCVVYGEYDAPAYPHIEDRRGVIARVCPDVDFRVIEAGGHWVQYEKADIFNALALGWLAEQSSSGVSSRTTK